MNFLLTIVELFDEYVYSILPSSILTLLIVELVYKHRFGTYNILNIIRWVVIAYTFLTFTLVIFEFLNASDNQQPINRAIGPYAVFYWIMTLSALILPCSLFINKLASKFWYVFLVVFGMKIGLFFERFVIYSTSIHRDFLPSNIKNNYSFLFSYDFIIVVLVGVIFAFISLVSFELLNIYRRKSDGQYI